jgi:8-oxo-dGTP pyrophosphatase MutT (NUDIX family)
VIREVWEETGLDISIERLLLVNSWLPDRVGLYYLCSITGGKLTPSDEVSEFAYFSLDNLPDIKPIDVGMIKRLHGMVEHELA